MDQEVTLGFLLGVIALIVLTGTISVPVLIAGFFSRRSLRNGRH